MKKKRQKKTLISHSASERTAVAGDRLPGGMDGAATSHPLSRPEEPPRLPPSTPGQAR
jgi:hypothetical protein